MKKKLVVGLLLICSALCLSSCRNANRESQREERAEVERDKDNISGHKEKDTYISEESEEVIEQEIAKNKDVDYNWWENKCYVSEKTGGKFYGFRYNEGGEPYFTFGMCCVSIDKAQIEIIDDSYFGKVIGYTFQTQMLKNNRMTYDEYYVIYYIERDTIDVSNSSGTYSDSFVVDTLYREDYSTSNNQQEEGHTYLFDGQNFECFETFGGEDIMLTVHLYYSDDSDTPSAYKGEMNNGVEFWFELYDTHTDEERYKIKCLDNSNAFLTYYPSRGEIELNAEEGNEYGNLYSYSGTYICLPDEFEE